MKNLLKVIVFQLLEYIFINKCTFVTTIIIWEAKKAATGGVLELLAFLKFLQIS